MSWVRMPRLSKLPFMAVDLAIGSAIVLVHLVIAGRMDRPRTLALATHADSSPTSE